MLQMSHGVIWLVVLSVKTHRELEGRVKLAEESWGLDKIATIHKFTGTGWTSEFLEGMFSETALWLFH